MVLIRFFESYSGTILGDCWHGFGSIASESENRIVRAACNSHARRKFEEATDYPADRRKWMQWFQDLFDVETEAKDLPSQQRTALRHAKAKPIWALMRAELDSIDDRTEQVVLPKSDLRKALNYLRNHWTELTRYLDDPRLAIDNNECEQLMKQVAVGRKNWLFCGSPCRWRAKRRVHDFGQQCTSKRPRCLGLCERHSETATCRRDELRTDAAMELGQ